MLASIGAILGGLMDCLPAPDYVVLSWNYILGLHRLIGQHFNMVCSGAWGLITGHLRDLAKCGGWNQYWVKGGSKGIFTSTASEQECCTVTSDRVMNTWIQTCWLHTNYKQNIPTGCTILGDV
jgi:hypothetical protein